MTTTQFKFDDKDLQLPERSNYAQQVDYFQQKRDLVIAKHFLDFGKRNPGVEMDEDTMKDVLKNMEF